MSLTIFDPIIACVTIPLFTELKQDREAEVRIVKEILHSPNAHETIKEVVLILKDVINGICHLRMHVLNYVTQEPQVPNIMVIAILVLYRVLIRVTSHHFMKIHGVSQYDVIVVKHRLHVKDIVKEVELSPIMCEADELLHRHLVIISNTMDA